MTNKGDKFVIEIDAVAKNPRGGNVYYVKGFNNLTLDDYAVKRLRKYTEPSEGQKALEHHLGYLDGRVTKLERAMSDLYDELDEMESEDEDVEEIELETFDDLLEFLFEHVKKEVREKNQKDK